MQEKRVKGYPFETVRQKEELMLRTYEYDLPFNYRNVTVWRKDYDGGEFHGIEQLTSNPASPKARLTRIVPGEWTRMQTSFIVPPETASAEFRLDVAKMSDEETLWIADAFAGVVCEDWNVKAGFREFPFTGMSCAVFEIPKSKKVIIQGGSEVPGWLTDNAPDDNHYSFRTIRTTVAVKKEDRK